MFFLRNIPKRLKYRRPILENNSAISEELNAIPTLTVIIIGIGLFSLILFATYSNYNQRTEPLNHYHFIEYIQENFLNPNNGIAQYDGSISLESFQNIPQTFFSNIIYKSGTRNQYNVSMTLTYDNNSFYYPQQSTTFSQERYAVTTPVLIKINDVQVKSGTLTIILHKIHF